MIEKKLPYCYTLFQPYSSQFFEFLEEAKSKEHWSADGFEFLGNSDLGTFDYFEEQFVPLDLPILCEAKAEYQGQKVELNKPKSGEKNSTSMFKILKRKISRKFLLVQKVVAEA